MESVVNRMMNRLSINITMNDWVKYKILWTGTWLTGEMNTVELDPPLYTLTPSYIPVLLLHSHALV